MEETGDAATDAAFALLDTDPTTLAGVVALLRYSAEYVNTGNIWPNPSDYILPDGYGQMWDTTLCARVADALGKLVAV